MIEIVRERVVAASTAALWPVVDDPARLPEWFTFCDRAELLEGHGAGRRQRLHGRWGRKRFEVDLIVIVHEPPTLLSWRHEAERLDGRPAPQFARETTFEIRLEAGDGGTRVTLVSRQEPASGLKGLLIHLFGGREVARHMERSLERLANAESQPIAGTTSSASRATSDA